MSRKQLLTGVAPAHHLDRRANQIATSPEATGPDDELLTTAAVAAWLGVSLQFLEIARHRGHGPKFVRLTPRMIRYRRGDVLAWLRERAHRSTAEYAEERHAG